MLALCVPGSASAHTLGVAAASWDALVLGWTLPFESAVLITWMVVIGIAFAHFSRERSIFYWVGSLFVGLGLGFVMANTLRVSEPLALILFGLLALWVTVFFGLSARVFQPILIALGVVAGAMTRQSHPELLAVWSIHCAALLALVMVPMMIAAALRLPGDRWPQIGTVVIRVFGSWMVALSAMQAAFLIQA